jgi:crotonobetainyl-CoA:carnitine CoA-transferase CaiB-like acyl-CoA transferase
MRVPVPPELSAELIRRAWAELVTDAAPGGAPEPVEIIGGRGVLRSRFPVEDVAVASVALAMSAASVLHRQRGGAFGKPRLDRSHVAAAVRSERYFRRARRSGAAGFASLSRFWPTADGWLRTHANYPWHRAALLSTLGTPEDVSAVAATMAERHAGEVEEAVFSAGGVAGAVRSLDAWATHPQGVAVAQEPLIGHRMVGAAAPRVRGPADLPASGIRVLDLTRVIAGPVCTRYLAAMGASVLRLDPPAHLDMPAGEVADTLLGKRSALLDLGSRGADATLHRLLGQADLVVCGYRPGALDRFGLSEDYLTERHPGITAVYLAAWGHSGPWMARRGFDSIVQAPTGIAIEEKLAGDEPGVLPCQLLDHGTGYLAAAAALDGLRRQADHGGTHIRRVSLARTAWWLTSLPRRPADVAAAEAALTPWLVELDSATGPVTAVSPPGKFGSAPLRWPSPVTGYGDDPPSWTSA